MEDKEEQQDAAQPQVPSRAEERAAELVRRARRLAKAGKPRIDRIIEQGKPRIGRLIEQGKPRAERAGRHAIRFAQEHEDEIKLVGLRAARMRFHGPLGLVIDALSRPGSASSPRQAAGKACPACQAHNSLNARFCNQCGTRLESQD